LSAAAATRDVAVGCHALPGRLTLPGGSAGLVVFAHGSGSSRSSPRNQQVARAVEAAGMGTLLFDLLHEDEARDRRRVFDIPLLAERVVDAIAWCDGESALEARPIGLFGASTGAAAALVAAARRPDRVAAVVSRGGRPDLAMPVLAEVRAPTLLIVGGADTEVLAMNRDALARLGGPKTLDVVPGATHLFEEPGTLEAMTARAVAWFERHLTPPATGG
jgi:pimeloyl-ACP methyl ester carboxylesterase